MDEKIFSQIIERLAKIEVKIDDIKGLQEKVSEHDRVLTQLQEKDANQQKEIDDLKSNQKWVVVAIVGAVIAGILKVTLGI